MVSSHTGTLGWAQFEAERIDMLDPVDFQKVPAKIKEVNLMVSKDETFKNEPNTNRNKNPLNPSWIQVTAMKLMEEVEKQKKAVTFQKLLRADAASDWSRPIFGSTEKWLSGTDEAGQLGEVYNEEAQSNPSQPKPSEVPFGGMILGPKQPSSLSTLTKKAGSTISVIQSPDEWIEIEITVDSGACETVMPASLCSCISITKSSTSHGAEYEVANGQTLPNLGERRCQMMTIGSASAKKIVFQVADVHKPLLSISRCADLGFNCHLGETGGYLEDRVTGETIPLQRRDNLYVTKAWVRRDPDPSPEPPFQRPV